MIYQLIKRLNLINACLICSIIISIFLFCAGTYVLSNIGSPKAAGQQKGSPSAFSPFLEPFQISEEPFNALFMVKEKSGGNTDTMLLINFDPAKTKISVMSIPRDTYYEVSGAKIPKINSAYAIGGPDKAVKAVSEILSVNIKYYIHIKITTFKKIIDLLGGIDFYVPADLDYDDPAQDLHIHLKKGIQKLDGDKAEQLLRFRETQNGRYKGEISNYYDGSDLKREEMQKQFVKALIDQKMNIRYITKINDIINTVFDDMDKNVALSDALRYVGRLTNIKSDGIEWFKLPGESKRKTYWYFFVDETEAVKITKEHFLCNSSFIQSTESSEEDKDTGSKLTPDSGSPKDAKSKKGSFTKGNPSNSKSNIKPKSSSKV